MDPQSGAPSRRVLALVREQGRRQGRSEGRREALLGVIGSVCEALGIPLDTAARVRLSALGAEELESLLHRVLTERRVP